MTKKRCVLATLTLITTIAIACGTAQPTPAVSPTLTPLPTKGPAAEAQQASGMTAYERSCARCHGANLEDGFSPKLSRPVLASYDTALELYEYLRSAMPKGNAGSLLDQEYYDITAYLLFEQGLLSEEQVVDADSAPNIQLPD